MLWMIFFLLLSCKTSERDLTYQRFSVELSLSELLKTYKEKPFYKLIYSEEFKNILIICDEMDPLNNKCTDFVNFLYVNKFENIPENFWQDIKHLIQLIIEKNMGLKEEDYKNIALLNLKVHSIKIPKSQKKKNELLAKIQLYSREEFDFSEKSLDHLLLEYVHKTLSEMILKK